MILLIASFNTHTPLLTQDAHTIQPKLFLSHSLQGCGAGTGVSVKAICLSQLPIMDSIERHGGGLVVKLCYGVQQLPSPVGDALCWQINGGFITNLGGASLLETIGIIN